MPRQKINERGEKTIMTEIILYKRKGGIGLIGLIGLVGLIGLIGLIEPYRPYGA